MKGENAALMSEHTTDDSFFVPEVKEAIVSWINQSFSDKSQVQKSYEEIL